MCLVPSVLLLGTGERYKTEGMQIFAQRSLRPRLGPCITSSSNLKETNQEYTLPKQRKSKSVQNNRAEI